MGVFLLAAPLLDPLVLAVLLLLFGWQATVAYAAVTAVVVLLLALAAEATALERWLLAARQRVGVTAHAGAAADDPQCADDPFVDERPWQGLRDEALPAGRYAWRLVQGLAAPMAVAQSARSSSALCHTSCWSRLAGPDNPLAVPAAAALGAPFYVSTEAFLPIAAGLHNSGMGLGAVFALVISAAGVNLPELALLSRTMRPHLLVAYTNMRVRTLVAQGNRPSPRRSLVTQGSLRRGSSARAVVVWERRACGWRRPRPCTCRCPPGERCHFAAFGCRGQLA